MKKQLLILFLFLSLFTVAQQQTVSYSVSPSTFNEDESITLTFQGSSINEATWNVTNNALYLWSWSFDANNTNQQDSPTNGTWTNSNEANRLTYNSGTDTYSITFVPTTFYARTGIGRIGFLIKAKDGTGDKKSQDILVDVGKFQLILNTPTESTIFVNTGNSVSIAATTSLSANFTLKANGSTINTQNGITSYSFSPTVNTTTSFVLEATDGNETQSVNFTAIASPTVTSLPIPSGIREGINYDLNDNTKVILALKAPFKDYVYVTGSFNNYTPNNTYLMNRDVTDTDLYWIEITGLTPNQVYTYQYWVVDENPITNSPRLVKTADPYSTLVLSPDDDPGIPSSSYPNIPAYPTGQERDVTVIETGQSAYNWQVTNFEKPKKEDLIIYEVLIRDFDVNRNYQDLIDRMNYFKDLNINAIQLMPIMEFEGNETWGYNTSFHMALDKFYGTSNKFKEFVDLCHQNGIAVILDIALNHATGRNPMVRMWMDDPDDNGWGDPSSENPYFNTVPQHDYNVFNDFNHQSTLTQNYTKRVVEHWVKEYNIDGFRWDLTKGFTQNCGPSSSAGCTDAYQADRVQLLKEYADYSWSLDPTHYVIFEHLGTDNEEKEWADYRLDDSDVAKGIMMWGKMTTEYTDLVQGYNTNISRADHKQRNFNQPRLIMYPESHDEERVMYEAVTFGNNSTSSHNVRNLEIATKRMAAMAAVSYVIPGPKMIWHFSDLGMDDSIFTCNNGSVNNPDCKLDTKPQPQWTNNWLNNSDRKQIYDTWSHLFDLKINEDVFEGDFVLEGTNQSIRLYIFDNNLPSSQLKNIVILANFRTIDQNIIPDFPNTGTWYNLMDNTPITVSATNTPMLIPAGEFKIFGNQPSTLSTQNLATTNARFTLYPNPVNNQLRVNQKTSAVIIYNILGKEVANFKGDFTSQYPFDVSKLTSGLYVLKAETDKGLVVKKFVKD